MLAQVEASGFRYIAGLEAARRRLWESACGHDDIPADSSFVVFSDDNPFVQFMAPLERKIREARAAHVPGGGYVGLRIEKGRAVIDEARGRKGSGREGG